jgi:phospholipase/carboxylesterase
VRHRIETVTAGAALAHAATAVVLLHGRGADAGSMLGLADALALPNVAYLAPQAPGGSWYPRSFLAPFAANEPYLSRALAQVGSVFDEITSQGFPAERIAIVGFSQGGCLGLEFAARNANGLGAVAGLSAGLIGPPGTSRAYTGRRAGLRVLLGCSDVDGHIPLARVHETESVLRSLGADVDARIYPGMGHTINADEIQALRNLLAPRLETETEQTLIRRTAS